MESGQSHLNELASSFGRKGHARRRDGQERDLRRFEMWQGLKPDSFYWPFSARLKPCPGYRALHLSSYKFFSSL
jgi:hypothetical protein